MKLNEAENATHRRTLVQKMLMHRGTICATHGNILEEYRPFLYLEWCHERIEVMMLFSGVNMLAQSNPWLQITNAPSQILTDVVYVFKDTAFALPSIGDS